MAISPTSPATGGRAPKRRHSLPAESDRQQAMDDPNLDLPECGVSDPKEAQRAWLERFRDRIEAVP
jgi:hypothetical protein